MLIHFSSGLTYHWIISALLISGDRWEDICLEVAHIMIHFRFCAAQKKNTRELASALAVLPWREYDFWIFVFLKQSGFPDSFYNPFLKIKSLTFKYHYCWWASFDQFIFFFFCPVHASLFSTDFKLLPTRWYTWQVWLLDAHLPDVRFVEFFEKYNSFLKLFPRVNFSPPKEEMIRRSNCCDGSQQNTILKPMMFHIPINS